MIRITWKDLERAATRLNRAKGTPEHAYIGNVAQIGNYHIDGAYGGVKLVQIVSEGGGIRCISQGGYIPKRELYNQIHGMLEVLS